MERSNHESVFVSLPNSSASATADDLQPTPRHNGINSDLELQESLCNIRAVLRQESLALRPKPRSRSIASTKMSTHSKREEDNRKLDALLDQPISSVQNDEKTVSEKKMNHEPRKQTLRQVSRKSTGLDMLRPTFQIDGSRTAEEDAAAIFAIHDGDGDGTLDRLEFKNIMKDLQSTKLDSMGQRKFGQESRRLFNSADQDGSRRLDVDEFVKFYVLTMQEEYQKRDSDSQVVKAQNSKLKTENESGDTIMNLRAHWQKSECSLAVFIANGDLQGLKETLDTLDDEGQSKSILGGIPPIVLAAHCQQLHIVQWLLSSAHVDQALQKTEISFIRRACERGDTREVQQLINDLYAHGIRRCEMMRSFVTDDLEQARDTMLKHYQAVTIKRNHNHISRQPIDLLPTLLLPEKAGREQHKAAEALFTAAGSGDEFKLQGAIKMIISCGLTLEIMDKLHNTALMIASKFGHDGSIKHLLRHGADPERLNLYNESSIFFAARQNQLDTIRILGPLSPHVLFLRNCNGKRPVDAAKTYYVKEYLATYMMDIVGSESLVPRGAPVRRRAGVGASNVGHIRFSADQLAMAIYHQDIAFIRRKHKHDEIVDEPDGFSLTPLMHACASGNVDVVKYLLKHDLAQRCVNFASQCTKMTALHFAYESNCKQIVDLLLKSDARGSKRKKNIDGLTPSQCSPDVSPAGSRVVVFSDAIEKETTKVTKGLAMRQKKGGSGAGGVRSLAENIHNVDEQKNVQKSID